MSLWLVLLALLVSGSTARLPWNGDYIDWVEWGNAIKIAEKEKKPIFMLIHKTWCAACKALEESFQRSAEIEVIGSHFVMANVEDEDEPTDKQYQAQGSYSPRILFLDSQGVVSSIVNELQPNAMYVHNYFETEAIVDSMLRALTLLSHLKNDDEL